MQNFIMPVVGHTISLTRLVTDPTSRDNPDRQQGVLGDSLREVRVKNVLLLLSGGVEGSDDVVLTGQLINAM